MSARFAGLTNRMTMAAATTKLKVATGICLVIEHDPIVLAKQVASVDLASNGRVHAHVLAALAAEPA